jgi:hypothetical protein
MKGSLLCGQPASLDGRVLFHYYWTGVTPDMAMKMVGAGSQHAAATTDSQGRPLDGSKTYKIHRHPGQELLVIRGL